jgi:hypothetical protein
VTAKLTPISSFLLQDFMDKGFFALAYNFLLLLLRILLVGFCLEYPISSTTTPGL